MIDDAVKKDNIDMLIVLHKLFDDLSDKQLADVMEAAVLYGSVNALRYVHNNILPVFNTERLSLLATARGDMNMMIFFAEVAGFLMTEEHCIQAVRSGKLEPLSWLVAEGCPHDENVLIELAKKLEHVDILAWLTS